MQFCLKMKMKIVNIKIKDDRVTACQQKETKKQKQKTNKLKDRKIYHAHRHSIGGTARCFKFEC